MGKMAETGETGWKSGIFQATKAGVKRSMEELLQRAIPSSSGSNITSLLIRPNDSPPWTAMSRRRVRLLTGAPDKELLDWSDDRLLTRLLPQFISSTSPSKPLHHDASITDSSIISTFALAKWRHIPLDGTVFYQTPQRKTYATPTRPFSSLLSISDNEADFIDHSLALHEDIQSSQLAPHENEDGDNDTSFQSTSLLTSTPSTTSFSTSQPSVQPLSLTAPITPLSSLPSPSHLLRLRPQTLTITAVVALISISEPRDVHIRRGKGYTMTILELLVGDETRSPFSVTIWLDPAGDPLRETLDALRPGNVVCLDRLALGVWDGKVFGQTLRRTTGLGTRIVRLLPPGKGMGELSGPVKVKVERVREWMERFVGVAGRKRMAMSPPGGKRRSRRLAGDGLPPDSQ